MPSYDELRGRIEAVVLRWLPEGAGIENRLALEITRLARYAQAAHGGMFRTHALAVRTASRRRAESELKTLDTQLRRVIHALDRMHMDVFFTASAALTKAGIERTALENALEHLRAIDTSHFPGRARQRSKPLEFELIVYISTAYFGVTGKRPVISTADDTKPAGPFYRILQEMLEAMQLAQKIRPEAAAREVCQIWRHGRKSGEF